MKIAFVSYEFPPDTADGGIATYVGQAVRMLRQRGHHVEVFAGARSREGTFDDDGVIVHRTGMDRTPEQFYLPVADVFARRHKEVGFDVIETGEYRAEARLAIKRCPEVPLLVRLHTASFLLMRMNPRKLAIRHKVRATIGAWRRGQRPYFQYAPNNDPEYIAIRDADVIAAPCGAIAAVTANAWNLDRNAIEVYPYPYVPSQRLLEIPIEPVGGVVTFLGRLEIRKGVLDLARAIPLVLSRRPHARFRFVGRPADSPEPGRDMREYLRHELVPWSSNVEFLPSVPLDEVPVVLAQTDVCVFPSLWENFPNVCLEAMSAARAVVGGGAGGMVEMLDRGRVGRLVKPRRPRKLATAILELLADPALRADLGSRARRRVLDCYGHHAVAPIQEASYARAIECRRLAGPRKPRDEN